MSILCKNAGRFGINLPAFVSRVWFLETEGFTKPFWWGVVENGFIKPQVLKIPYMNLNRREFAGLVAVVSILGQSDSPKPTV